MLGDPTKTFFQVALNNFMDPLLEIQQPKEEHWMPEHLEEDWDCWDPNNPAIFEHDRLADWLMETWTLHIKPRHKKALDKWNMDAGGGDGTPASFIDFSGNDKWLVWVFLHDCEANFLLANNASGRVPNHLQLEIGFGNIAHMSDLTGDDESKMSSKRLKSFEKQLLEIKESCDNVNDLTGVISACFKSKHNGKESDLTPSKLNCESCFKECQLLSKADSCTGGWLRPWTRSQRTTRWHFEVVTQAVSFSRNWKKKSK